MHYVQKQIKFKREVQPQFFLLSYCYLEQKFPFFLPFIDSFLFF